MFGFLRKAIPAAAGIFGSPAAGAIAGGVLGAVGAGREAGGIERAGAAAGRASAGGYNYLAGSPVGASYVPAGGRAVDQQAALLGAGGDPAAAEEAYNNYLNSIGFRGQLEAGQDAVTTSAAARGLLGSGSTARGLQRTGQQLGREAFNNYLSQLGGVAGMGLQAGGQVGQAATQRASDAARYAYGSGADAAGARARGWDQLVGGLGGAWDAWRAGRSPRIPEAPGAYPDPGEIDPMTGELIRGGS